jgi:YegS/Rv2252/BmrU family lipid kinase
MKGAVFLNPTGCILIVNPTSGREKALRYIPLMESALKKRYLSVTLKMTEKAGDATAFASAASRLGQDVFCMGGDGTINETINGMVSAGSTSTFGFVPLGTVNDLARALHIPLSPKAAIRMFPDAVRTTIDIGRVNDRFFVNIAAAGRIPEAVGQVSIREKTLWGPLAYFIKGFQSLRDQNPHHFHVLMEDGRTFDFTSPLMAAMLTDSAGSFRNLLPSCEYRKHQIRLVFLKKLDWLDLLSQAPVLIKGAPVSSDLIHVLEIQKAKVSLSEGEHLMTNVDGDMGPEFPLDMELLPCRLSIFVPREKHRAEGPLHFPEFLRHLTDHIMP